MWRYEQEFRVDKPETEGKTDKYSDLDNYKDWLEEQLTNCRKQLPIHNVSNLLCDSFEPDNKTSSATKCKCGREKWEHPKTEQVLNLDHRT